MNLHEAYSTLGLSESSSPEEAKKKYKELTKKYHPDINKEPGAEDKFKRINEAYQCVQNGKGNDEPVYHTNSSGFGGFNINDIFNFNNVADFFARGNARQSKPISIKTTISMKEAVFGCKKELSFMREVKCNSCSGRGKFSKNRCHFCDDTGFITRQNGPVIMRQNCPNCHMTKKEFIKCDNCKSGRISVKTELSVNIPPGIENNSSLRLNNIGNWVDFNPMQGDVYSEVFVNVSVVEDNRFKVIESDVITKCTITLKEAVVGCSKIVPTLDGDVEINIPKLSKHKDNIILNNKGVGRVGNQRVVLNVEYPENIMDLL